MLVLDDLCRAYLFDRRLRQHPTAIDLPEQPVSRQAFRRLDVRLDKAELAPLNVLDLKLEREVVAQKRLLELLKTALHEPAEGQISLIDGLLE